MVEFNLDIFKTVVAIISFVLSIVSFLSSSRKKKAFLTFESFLSFLSEIIQTVEKLYPASTGDLKKSVVLRNARDWLFDHHLSLTDEKISELIENFLSTPEKK